MYNNRTFLTLSVPSITGSGKYINTWYYLNAGWHIALEPSHQWTDKLETYTNQRIKSLCQHVYHFKNRVFFCVCIFSFSGALLQKGASTSCQGRNIQIFQSQTCPMTFQRNSEIWSYGKRATIGKAINLLHHVNKMKVSRLKSQMIRQSYPLHQ